MHKTYTSLAEITRSNYGVSGHPVEPTTTHQILPEEEHIMNRYYPIGLCCILVSIVEGIDVTSTVSRLSQKTLKQRTDDARDYWAEGDLSLAERKPHEAIPFHRAALRLLPESVDYLLNVATAEFTSGVSENRMDLIHKAYKRMQTVLRVDPTNKIAQFYSEKMREEYDICIEERCLYWDNLANVLEFPELEAAKELLSCGNECFEFPSFSHRSAQPFVIRDILQHIACDLAPLVLDRLYDDHGTVAVDFYPQNMIVKPTKVYNEPLSKALQYLLYPEGAYLSVDASEPGTYIQWNMNETTWDTLLVKTGLNRLPRILTHSLDTLFDQSKYEESSVSVTGTTVLTNVSSSKLASFKHAFGLKTHWYMMLLGEADAGMFPHQDTLAVGSWQVQVAGSKRWRVCSPTPPSDIAEGVQGPRFAMGTEKGQQCYETILRTGDLLYYPPYYWHETKSLESPSVSLSGTVVVDSAVHDNVGAHVPNEMGNNYKEVLINSLRAECRDQKRGFGFDVELCNALS